METLHRQTAESTVMIMIMIAIAIAIAIAIMIGVVVDVAANFLLFVLQSSVYIKFYLSKQLLICFVLVFDMICYDDGVCIDMITRRIRLDSLGAILLMRMIIAIAITDECRL